MLHCLPQATITPNAKVDANVELMLKEASFFC